MVAVGVLQTISKILLIKDRKELDEIELWQFYWISQIMIIGIEAIVACIMSIDKDDPPRRGVEGQAE